MPRGVYKRFNRDQEIIEFIQKNASEEIPRGEMRKMIIKKFGIEVSKDWVRHKYRKYGLPSLPGNNQNRLLTKEQAEYMISIIPGRYSTQIAQMMNEKYGLDLTSNMVRQWKKNNKTPSGIDTRYRSGRKCAIKGKKWDEFMPVESQANSRKTQFKKGNIPANHAPIGTITTRSEYKWIKIRDGYQEKNWMLLHRYVWEQANGPIPKGYRIMFRDGNPLNCSLDNLKLVDEKVIAIAATRFGMSNDAELNEAILKAAELKIAIADKKRREKNDTN